MKKKPKEKKVGDLKPGDLFHWEQEIYRCQKVERAGSLGRGPQPWKSEVSFVKALDRHPKPMDEILNSEMLVRLATKAEVDREANCCDGFEHEGCEVWDCPACPTCNSHHSAARPGGACCKGLSKPEASDADFVSVRPADR